ncbi:lipopolysaccharide transport system ATP-binding protein [Kineothrix alysoides]|uniref:Lipopolysaccharide transport system ATP-binding protein n=1 Tax=Kineothrix alysoides TaxID=1469948 RepID=A0A4R1R226_9FIRM|nr:ABC transporter ATP-binding protein [Kineothrix alysoides]TCL59368.1 lipopolysaccharide transport system ATP-binding protein [Kineothrix alysoides]
MDKLAIKIENLSKVYKLYENNKSRIVEGLFPFAKCRHKDFYALQDLSFEIEKGEIVGIIGKNGSGKSTLLKIITGVLSQSGGSVEVKGRISALLELGAGFNPEYTGIENIYLNGTLNGITREEMSKRIYDIADFADIGDFIYQPVKNYSSGMFVRLAFAVAVNVEPDILIVDEALAVGDAAFQAKCMARMNQIMKGGATVLFVTHDMNTVKRLCQRCIYLENGKKIMEGNAEELADVYLKRIRENMNIEHLKVMDVSKEEEGIIDKTERDAPISTKECSKDLYNVELEKRIAPFREGTGTVKLINFELTDINDVVIKSAEFNQKLKIKMCIKFFQDAEVGIGYHIRDDKNMEIIGSGTTRELGHQIRGKEGEIYLVEFSTRVPLVEGIYNISTVVSTPIILNRSALFVDYAENVEVFEVEECKDAKLWDKVYVPNEVEINKLV